MKWCAVSILLLFWSRASYVWYIGLMTELIIGPNIDLASLQIKRKIWCSIDPRCAIRSFCFSFISDCCLVRSYAAVILVPTRELALQTSQVCKELGKHLKIQVMVTTGGTSLKDDIMRLYQPVHLLVGTPGRILDLAKKGVCILKDCSMLIMDEVILSWVSKSDDHCPILLSWHLEC